MIRANVTATALLIGLLFLSTPIRSQSIYFIDQMIRDLQQLDQALADGEISGDDYDVLLEALLRGGDPELTAFRGITVAPDTTEVTAGVSRSAWRFQYRGSFTQELEQDHSQVRYDRIRLRGRGLEVDLSLEQRDDREVGVRSRSIAYRHGGSRVVVGSFNLKLASGLTQGLSGFQRDLAGEDTFIASFGTPSHSRGNGLLLVQRVGHFTLDGWISRHQGNRLAKTGTGAAVQFDRGGQQVGIIGSGQELAADLGRSQRRGFLAPFFELKTGHLKLTGESSFAIGAAAAHLYSLSWQDKADLTVRLFSYGKRYDNLQSGGFAYSDYETATIDVVEFDYRDRRRGRRGVSCETGLRLCGQRLTGNVIRWQNRIDARDCAAAKLWLERGTTSGLTRRLRLTAVWENLDLDRDNQKRWSVALSWRLSPTPSVSLTLYQKFEDRTATSGIRKPLRSRGELLLRLSPLMTARFAANYYDPDRRQSGNSYFYLTACQDIERGSRFKITTSIRTRYHLGDRQFSGWQLRVSCIVST